MKKIVILTALIMSGSFAKAEPHQMVTTTLAGVGSAAFISFSAYKGVSEVQAHLLFKKDLKELASKISAEDLQYFAAHLNEVQNLRSGLGQNAEDPLYLTPVGSRAKTTVANAVGSERPLVLCLELIMALFMSGN